MDNYEFCAKWVTENAVTGSRVLDYGCGAGQIVKLLLASRYDAFGCDVFFEGGDYSGHVDPALLGSRIRRMEGDTIPFDDNSFDLVTNNQVMEHVPDMERALTEIARVLRPGGKVLSLFPDRGVWREGHCGIPFLHWFPRGSDRVRVGYAAALRAMGFGHFKKDKSILKWSRDFCEWLDLWTHYRSNEEIDRHYRMFFAEETPIEDRYLLERAGPHHLVLMLPKPLQRWLVRKLMGRVFVVTKPT
jgi:SAM-dependent methyltransferase